MDEPLIYTSKGNLPIASLEYRHAWHEDEIAIVFSEEYWLNGELVKRSSHSRLKKGIESSVQKQIFGVT